MSAARKSVQMLFPEDEDDQFGMMALPPPASRKHDRALADDDDEDGEPPPTEQDAAALDDGEDAAAAADADAGKAAEQINEEDEGGDAEVVRLPKKGKKRPVSSDEDEDDLDGTLHRRLNTQPSMFARRINGVHIKPTSTAKPLKKKVRMNDPFAGLLGNEAEEAAHATFSFRERKIIQEMKACMPTLVNAIRSMCSMSWDDYIATDRDNLNHSLASLTRLVQKKVSTTVPEVTRLFKAAEEDVVPHRGSGGRSLDKPSDDDEDEDEEGDEPDTDDREFIADDDEELERVPRLTKMSKQKAAGKPSAQDVRANAMRKKLGLMHKPGEVDRVVDDDDDGHCDDADVNMNAYMLPAGTKTASFADSQPSSFKRKATGSGTTKIRLPDQDSDDEAAHLQKLRPPSSRSDDEDVAGSGGEESGRAKKGRRAKRSFENEDDKRDYAQMSFDVGSVFVLKNHEYEVKFRAPDAVIGPPGPGEAASSAQSKRINVTDNMWILTNEEMRVDTLSTCLEAKSGPEDARPENDRLVHFLLATGHTPVPLTTALYKKLTIAHPKEYKERQLKSKEHGNVVQCDGTTQICISWSEYNRLKSKGVAKNPRTPAASAKPSTTVTMASTTTTTASSSSNAAAAPVLDVKLLQEALAWMVKTHFDNPSCSRRVDELKKNLQIWHAAWDECKHKKEPMKECLRVVQEKTSKLSQIRMAFDMCFMLVPSAQQAVAKHLKHYA